VRLGAGARLPAPARGGLTALLTVACGGERWRAEKERRGVDKKITLPSKSILHIAHEML